MKTKIPEGFSISPTMAGWAEAKAPVVNIEKETEVFKDYWLATGKTMEDWEACWRNWMRRSPQMGGALYSQDELRLRTLMAQYTAEGFRPPIHGESALMYEAAFQAYKSNQPQRDLSSVFSLVKQKKL